LRLGADQVAKLLCLNAFRFFGISITEEIIPYKLEKGIINKKYNNGVVANPWTGAELYFPVPIKK